ncbi:MAG TPA: aminotransferase class V-fold PLP-dependent enzyme [bacterium]|nr:aminotransferase class V-fold PLP-dependent enzyme [bacterium]
MRGVDESLRAGISLPDGVAYLNWASQGIIPNASLEAMMSILKLRGRTDVDIAGCEFEAADRARALSARLIGASPAEICLTTSTSVGINIAAQAIPFEPGDEVLLLDVEFPTNVVPWRNLERRGVKVRTMSIADRFPSPELLEAQMGPRTRAISVSFVQFHDGFRNGLATIGSICRSRGIYFVVDAMQGLGVCPLSVNEINAHFVATGGTKWLVSPYGTGFCYIRQDVLDRIAWLPAQGWLAFEYLGHDFSQIINVERRLLPGARRFEVGTLPWHDFAGFDVSVELLLQVGIEAIYAHVAGLYDRLVEGLSSIPNISVKSCLEPTARSGILSISSPDPGRLCEFLKGQGVFVSHREGAIRVAIHGFNNEEDIDRLLAATETFVKR